MNLDQVTNLDPKAAGQVAFKLVDKLQLEDRDKQLAGAALFIWALCEGLDIHPSRLLEAVDRCARDADRKMVPSVGALVKYVQNELRGIAP